MKKKLNRELEFCKYILPLQIKCGTQFSFAKFQAFQIIAALKKTPVNQLNPFNMRSSLSFLIFGVKLKEGTCFFRRKAFMLAKFLLCLFFFMIPVYADKLALVIAISKYKNFDSLATPVNDGQKLAQILRQRYNYRVSTLFDEKATRRNILHAFRKFCAQTKSEEAEQVLIYYAGHGVEYSLEEEGYWIPYEAKETEDFISNVRVKKFVQVIAAKELLLVADSCFSGQLLTRVIPAQGHYDQKNYGSDFLTKKSSLPIKLALTSGGVEPVLDRSSGRNHHSVFATKFLEVLEKNKRVVFQDESSPAFQKIRDYVSYNSRQNPSIGVLYGSGSDKGSFVFQAIKTNHRYVNKDFQGTWYSNYGKITLVYEDGKNQGSYPGGRIIHWAVADNTLFYHYWEEGVFGKGSWKIISPHALEGGDSEHEAWQLSRNSKSPFVPPIRIVSPEIRQGSVLLGQKQQEMVLMGYVLASQLEQFYLSHSTGKYPMVWRKSKKYPRYYAFKSRLPLSKISSGRFELIAEYQWGKKHHIFFVQRIENFEVVPSLVYLETGEKYGFQFRAEDKEKKSYPDLTVSWEPSTFVNSKGIFWGKEPGKYKVVCQNKSLGMQAQANVIVREPLAIVLQEELSKKEKELEAKREVEVKKRKELERKLALKKEQEEAAKEQKRKETERKQLFLDKKLAEEKRKEEERIFREKKKEEAKRLEEQRRQELAEKLEWEKKQAEQRRLQEERILALGQEKRMLLDKLEQYYQETSSLSIALSEMEKRLARLKNVLLTWSQEPWSYQNSSQLNLFQKQFQEKLRSVEQREKIYEEFPQGQASPTEIVFLRETWDEALRQTKEITQFSRQLESFEEEINDFVRQSQEAEEKRKWSVRKEELSQKQEFFFQENWTSRIETMEMAYSYSQNNPLKKWQMQIKGLHKKYQEIKLHYQFLRVSEASPEVCQSLEKLNLSIENYEEEIQKCERKLKSWMKKQEEQIQNEKKARYQLPKKLWSNCRYLNKGNYILDTTTSHWRKLSLRDRRLYIQMYQESYAQNQGVSSEEEFSEENVSFFFVLIPPGRFFMGPKDSSSRVVISEGFWLSRYEITQEQWFAFTQEKPWNKTGRLPESKSPATHVNWLEIYDKFLRRLPASFFLPSEAQWEYACRAGTTSRFYWGEDSQYQKILSYAWYDKNSDFLGQSLPHLVGAKKANFWGLYDMSGNVSEWCSDWYTSPRESPLIQGSKKEKVIRGGYWYDQADNCSSFYRHPSNPFNRSAAIGFRIARKMLGKNK